MMESRKSRWRNGIPMPNSEVRTDPTMAERSPTSDLDSKKKKWDTWLTVWCLGLKITRPSGDLLKLNLGVIGKLDKENRSRNSKKKSEEKKRDTWLTVWCLGLEITRPSGGLLKLKLGFIGKLDKENRSRSSKKKSEEKKRDKNCWWKAEKVGEEMEFRCRTQRSGQTQLRPKDPAL